MRTGLIRVSYESLHEMLDLPTSWVISRIMDGESVQTNDFVVRVVGDDLPDVPELYHIPEITVPR